MRETNRTTWGDLSRSSASRTATEWQSSRSGDLAPGGTLRPNFHHAPLELVLNYMRDAGGFVFRIKPNVELQRELDFWNEQPLKKEDALALLKHALDEKGYTAIEDGRMLTIIRSEDACKNYIPISAVWSNLAGSSPPAPGLQ